MKIKTIIAIYECPSCGSLVEAKRDFIVDEYLDKKIEIPNSMCSCGRKGKKKLVDIKIEDKPQN